MQSGIENHCHCEEYRCAMRRGNLPVTSGRPQTRSINGSFWCCLSVMLPLISFYCTRGFPRQGFALPRNDMVVGGCPQSHNCSDKRSFAALLVGWDQRMQDDRCSSGPYLPSAMAGKRSPACSLYVNLFFRCFSVNLPMFYPNFSILIFLEFFSQGWKFSFCYVIMRLSIP